ncbi:MAG TPA: DUF4097 family beta strand repeat-containing protein [Chthoniobacterales bacterium]
MLLRILLLLLLSTSLAFAHTEETVVEQLDVGPGGNLVVDVSFGTVEVAPGSGDKVSVEARRKIDMRDEAKERQFLAEAPIVITKDGNTAVVRARRVDKRSWTWSGSINMDGQYTIRVPKNFNLDLTTGGGAIVAADINGSLKASTSGGKLKLSGMKGPIDAKTSGGNITLAQCEGALNVKTSGGGIDARGGTGNLDARTSGGNIDVRDFKGDTVVKTSGGRLTFDNIGGRVLGETSGGSISAGLVSPVPGDVELSSSAGSIEVSVPADAALNIEARASSGTVSNSLPIVATRQEREELRGAMNGGGKSMVLRANAGSVSLRAATGKTARQ